MVGRSGSLIVLVGLMLAVGWLAGAGQVLAGLDENGEPNDDFSNATDVTTLEYKLFLNVEAGESDFYALDLDAGQPLDVTTEFEHGEGNIDLAVYGPDRTELARNTSTTDGESVTIRARRTGTHYVEVYGVGNATATYDLEIVGGDRFEPNDDLGSATRVSSAIYGNLSVTAGDEDVYAVDLDEGERFNVSIFFHQPAGNLDLAVRGPDGTELEANASLTDDEFASVVARESGTHYAVVDGFADASVAYRLVIFVTGNVYPMRDRFEPNDALGDATPVSPGTYTDLTIVDGESDFYAVDVGAGQELHAAISFEHRTGDLDLDVHGPDGTELAYSDSVTDNESARIVADGAGTYYVEVYGFEGDSGRYDLDVRVSDVVTPPPTATPAEPTLTPATGLRTTAPGVEVDNGTDVAGPGFDVPLAVLGLALAVIVLRNR